MGWWSGRRPSLWLEALQRFIGTLLLDASHLRPSARRGF
jgi:hypothetical protein